MYVIASYLIVPEKRKPKLWLLRIMLMIKLKPS